MGLACEKLLPYRAAMENFQLMTVARALKVDVDTSKAHDSLYDIEITKQVYDKLKQI